MMAPDDLEALVRRLQSTDVAEFECEGPEGRLRLRFARGDTRGAFPSTGGEALAAPLAPPRAVLKSPGIGHLHFRHPLGGPGGLAEGDRIEQGQLVAMLRIGELLLPVESDRDGVVGRLLAAEGELTGYGDPVLEWC